MYPLGHFGTALLFAAPVVALVGSRTQTGFAAYVLVTAILPDLDSHVPGLTHHGVTHTVAFAVTVGLVGGTLAGGTVWAARKWFDQFVVDQLRPRRIFQYATLGLFLGVVSHVTADVLVLLPGSQPVSPFWPVSDLKLTVEVVPLGAPLRNGLLLGAGLAVHAYLSWRVPAERGGPSSTG